MAGTRASHDIVQGLGFGVNMLFEDQALGGLVGLKGMNYMVIIWGYILIRFK